MKKENLILAAIALFVFDPFKLRSKGSGINGPYSKLSYTVLFAKQKGEKPAAAEYAELADAENFERDLKKDGWITMIVKK